MDDTLRRQLLAPAVYGFLVHCGGLPDLSVHLAEVIMDKLGIDEETFDGLSLCGYPSRMQNLFAANTCAETFGDLTGVDGFYKCRDLWWLDLDPKWSRNGFLMPVRDSKRGWFSGLFAFRHPGDGAPFPVRVRHERRAG